MICCLGDIHFRVDKDYFIKICNDFIEWFSNWKYNNSQNTLVLAGDLVEASVNSGIVIDFLERFYLNSRFKAIHICAGNHDKKKHFGITQLAYEFYKSKENIFIYEDPAETYIEDCDVLFLPYFVGMNDYGQTMKEYYSEIYKNPNFKNNYDLVVGHISDDSVLFGGIDCIANLDKINTRVLCLGHVHNRVNPNIYIGSIFANKKSENDDRRSAWILDKNHYAEDKLPLFNEFLNVSYPEKLPASKALTPIYTVLNCASENVARSKYGDIFIRKVVSSETETTKKPEEALARQFESIKNVNIPDLFDAYVKTQENTIDPKIVRKCKRLLVTSNY